MQIELQMAYFFTTSSTPKAQRLAWAPRTCQGTHWGKPGSIYSITLAVPKHKMIHTLYHFVTLHGIPWPYIHHYVNHRRMSRSRSPDTPSLEASLPAPSPPWDAKATESGMTATSWQGCTSNRSDGMLLCDVVWYDVCVCACVRVHGYMDFVCYWHTGCGHTDCVWT